MTEFDFVLKRFFS